MHPLLSVALFWAFLSIAMALVGYASIKFGVYTSVNQKETKSFLEV